MYVFVTVANATVFITAHILKVEQFKCERKLQKLLACRIKLQRLSYETAEICARSHPQVLEKSINARDSRFFPENFFSSSSRLEFADLVAISYREVLVSRLFDDLKVIFY